MEYYCYISQTKVDQLIAELSEKNPVEWTEDSTKSSDKRARSGISNLIALFNADLSYGRSDVFQTTVKLKMSYVSKLKTVLNGLANEVTVLEKLSDNKLVPGKYYLYRDKFVVKDIDRDNFMARLEAGNYNRRLVLHCSLKFFSESPIKDNAIKFNSTNYVFFEQKLPVSFETLFLFISRKENHLFGSPLYLKLSAQKNLLI